MTSPKSAIALSKSWLAARAAPRIPRAKATGIEPDRLLAIGQGMLGIFPLDEQDHGPHDVVVGIAWRLRRSHR